MQALSTMHLSRDMDDPNCQINLTAEQNKQLKEGKSISKKRQTKQIL